MSKEAERKRQWWQRQAEKPVIDNIPTMPDRLLNPDATTVEQAEFAKLLPGICEQLRAKRTMHSGNGSKTPKIREYSTDTRYGMCFLREVW